ncbi:ribonuclease I [Acinetobacter sp. A3.8]|uniref:Ribonuclease I n=1 Tax=Acinetobacter sedimenti TaxID=2919922 RepID=A0A9X1WXH5_9GAMM|nr:ribonuclease I [Acinetobacter sedimenti]MCJ8146944.1 ribonuclease I [Acinetobacter sedimenti]
MQRYHDLNYSIFDVIRAVIPSIFRFGGAFLFIILLSHASSVYAAPKSYVLHVELSPAVCQIDASQKRTRQCLEGYSLTVLGLFPEGVDTSRCETSSAVNLSPIQKRVLMRLIPDEASQARLWRSVGGCVSMNASQYFRKVVAFAEQLKIPSEVTSPTTIRVSRSKVENQFYRLNSGLSYSSLKMGCRGEGGVSNLLTDVEVCYRSNGKYQACQIQQRSTCPSQVLIKGSY